MADETLRDRVQGEFPRTKLLAAPKKIAATELAKFEPNEMAETGARKPPRARGRVRYVT